LISPLARSDRNTVHGLQELVGDRICTRPELEALVAEVSARPELWESRIDRGSEQRMYASLHRDAHVDVWAIFWHPGNDTGWHDHDISSGAVQVVQGALTNCGLRVGALDRRRTHRAGGSFSFDPPFDVRDRHGDLDPRLLGAPVAAGPVHRRRRRSVAAAIGLLRR